MSANWGIQGLLLSHIYYRNYFLAVVEPHELWRCRFTAFNLSCLEQLIYTYIIMICNHVIVRLICSYVWNYCTVVSIDLSPLGPVVEMRNFELPRAAWVSGICVWIYVFALNLTSECQGFFVAQRGFWVVIMGKICMNDGSSSHDQRLKFILW